MTELILFPIAFLFGLAIGVIATLIYWPWVEPHILGDKGDDHD